MEIKLLLLTIIFTNYFSLHQSPYMVSYVSENKDTLILPNNQLGKSIYKVWENESNKPIILFSDENTIFNKNIKINNNCSK